MKHTLAIVLLGAIFAAGSVSAADFGADRHGAKGVACASCHGEKNEVAYPSIEQCSKCHNPADMEKKTKDMKPVFGKAAVFEEKAIGKPDQGAYAYTVLLRGLLGYISK